ncbi:MAG: hypothetical protein JWN71_4905 [Xanthobacteraceae bacterium]|nr:hypothetical protein [Xanthobacteraceae bacterium]
MGKGTLTVEIKCTNCGSAVFQFPDNLTDDALIQCVECGKNVGPYGALKAAIQGQAHTVIGAHTETAIKPR